MSTTEDVFCLFERNSNFCCEYGKHVRPFTIGDQDAECDLKVKCYIKPGEECPICYDSIISKSTAFITSCGHSYHKKCLFKYIESKWNSTSYVTTARCPMCRCSLGHPDFVQRYHNSYFAYNYDKGNELDKLEDFWISNEYKLPNFCNNGYDHYLGVKSECFNCKHYRETGLEIN